MKQSICKAGGFRTKTISLQTFFILLLLSLFYNSSFAAESASLTRALSLSSTSAAPSAPSGGTSGISRAGTITPDLFSGTMVYSIPIDVPPGRKGLEPGLSLTYRSSNGNGWLGVGWELEVGSIERSTLNGVNYSGDDYILRMAGSNIDLLRINTDEAGNTVTDEYRAKIEGGFLRIRKLTASDGRPYWEVTDKSGTRYFYGQTAASRQDDPADANKIFKWCLDRVEDTNGNYMTVSYFKDQGQIYLDRIDYTGHTSGIVPTNYVKFYLEPRTDAPDMYSTNFRVRTAYRLKTIDIIANGARLRAYKLVYDTDPNTSGDQYSVSTERSILTFVQQFGNNATVDAGGTITGGSVLPAIEFNANSGTNGIIGQTWTTTAPNWGASDYTWIGDFNGDGKSDIATASGGTIWVKRSTGSSFVQEVWTTTASSWGSSSYTWVGDFNGDGKTDIATASGGTIWVKRSTGSSFVQEVWTTNAPNWGTIGAWAGDFNGDGKTDIATASTEIIWVKKSTGASFTEEVWKNGTDYNWAKEGYGYTWVGDFNGDGKNDLVTFNYRNPLSLVKSFLPPPPPSTIWVKLSMGSSFVAETWTTTAFNWGALGTWLGDFNGDGKDDIATASTTGTIWVKRSTGFSFIEEPWTTTAGSWGGSDYIRIGDFNGDGKSDIATASSGTIWVKLSNIFPVDLLTRISNSLGHTTNIVYTPATKFLNTLLPSPVQAVSSITTNDGNGVTSAMTLQYSGGFYHIGERDFRGFNYVKVTGPVGPNCEQTVTETWFHQGNSLRLDLSNPEHDAVVDAIRSNPASVNDPYEAVGYLKGKPYLTRVKDGQGRIYSESVTLYNADNSAPYFNPPYSTDSLVCDGDGVCGRHMQTDYWYDVYGNVTREDLYGDVNDVSDDMTVIRTYSPNTTAWILGLPANESIYQGTYPSVAAANLDPAKKVSETTFYYDGATDCNTASTNQTPTRGLATRIVRWHKEKLTGETDPEVRMAYDVFGNLKCTRDAIGNVATISYDSSNTFPTVATNPLGHQTVTQYYGVDGIPADKGLYGQVKSVTDPNGAVALTEYDTFGRKVLATAPDGTWTRWSYPEITSATNQYGAIGIGVANAQHVRVDTSVGISTWSYFDGLGRTFLEKKTGPENKTIATRTEYNATGTVKKSSLPYFDGTETPRWTEFNYDPMGRVTRVINPDSTISQACYDEGVTVAIDPEGHKKRETRNAQGKLIKVQEYLGTYADCATDVGTPYATTVYEYDVRGNLVKVTDAEANETRMTYDTLGRKTFMHDPDMGDWRYSYDKNGNLKTQTDAKGQTITFVYDALNRVTKKDYQDPAIADVVYVYDDPAVPYSKGRITKMTDASGKTEYFYDIMGRAVRTVKTVDGTAHPVDVTYMQGRMTGIKYPDGETVSYEYDATALSRVTDPATGKAYVAYSGFNALGQPGTMTYGNGITTVYQYHDQNNRLKDIITKNMTGQPILSLTYDYYKDGNIKNITDSLDPAKTQYFIYDEINRLIQAQSTAYGALFYVYSQTGNILNKEGLNYIYSNISAGPHAVTSTSDGKTYQYDANGNMISEVNDVTGFSRIIAYNQDNMPTAVTLNGVTTSFVYDGAGARVKKTAPSGITIYIGKLYECKNSACAKYIFAGDTRIALKSATETLYYHQDHLGSTRLVTDQTGAVREQAFYLPFGAAFSDTGTVSVNHKYTSQELDAETGLYYYNARYYNPILGRFISADALVRNFYSPQAFNRYSYVENNALRYTDPSGHFLVEAIVVGAVIGAVSSGAKNDWRFKDMFKGAVIGAVAGAAGYGAGTWSYGVAGGSGLGAMLSGGIVGGAAGGAAGGVMFTAFYGGNLGKNMLTGAKYGAIGGGITAGLLYVGIPGAFAAAGGGYASGYAQCGSHCGQDGALYAFAGQVLNNAITIAGYGAQGTVPREGSPEWRSMNAKNDVYVTTPSVSKSDILWLAIALLDQGYSHTWHTKDFTSGDDGYVPSGHQYRLVQNDVPWPGQSYADDNFANYSLTTNSCTSRFDYFTPGQYYSTYNYAGQGTYWWWGR